MGKRTLRTLHFDLVAARLKSAHDYWTARAKLYDSKQITGAAHYHGAVNAIASLAHDFADEFEIRAENFQRDKFLRQCGLEGK